MSKRKKNKPSYTPLPEVPEDLRARYAAVLAVMSGQTTVTEAAEKLGLSREQALRALEVLVGRETLIADEVQGGYMVGTAPAAGSGWPAPAARPCWTIRGDAGRRPAETTPWETSPARRSPASPAPPR